MSLPLHRKTLSLGLATTGGMEMSLPTLFGEKVKETLSTPSGVIDYDNLTYGDISSTIRNEGMKM